MDAVLVGVADFDAPSTETGLSSLGHPEMYPAVHPPGMTSISYWYRGQPASNTGQVLLYEGTPAFVLRHTASFSATWGSWQAVIGGSNPAYFTVKFGSGEPSMLRVSWFSGTYDPLQDPANPDFVPSQLCQYGTEKQPTAQQTTYLTPALIDLILTAVELPELAILFSGLWFTVLNVDQMCSSLPPPFPPITLDLLNASSGQLEQLFTALAWPYFCQCTSGTPVPIPPPEPTGPIPPGWPTFPVFPCDNIDPCSALVAMQSQLASIQQQLAPIRDLITSVQRFKVPFGYVGGTVHQGLSGEGQIVISRLVGFQVIVATLPADQLVLQSAPDYLWNLGWMSINDGAGMLQQRRIARQSHTWLPDQCQEASVFAFFLQPGVTINVVELLPEP